MKVGLGSMLVWLCCQAFGGRRGTGRRIRDTGDALSMRRSVALVGMTLKGGKILIEEGFGFCCSCSIWGPDEASPSAA